jgi:LacI family transcriptional regulator
VVRIEDVARLAGVSSATVSRALNDHPSVNPALVKRIRKAAAKLNYRGNNAARSLRRQRSDAWALIISDVGNPFFTMVARGVEDVAQRAGFSLLLCNSDEDPGKEARYLSVAAAEQVSGVILSPNMAGSDVSALQDMNIPVLAIDRPLLDVDSIIVDSREGARDATAHLLDEGWARPACITGPETVDTAKMRLTGYLDALREHRRRSSITMVRHADYRAGGGRAAMASLLDARRPPDAVLVANSVMALGVLDELKRRGLQAGRDLGLAAFDDAPWAAFVNPPMTVVAQPAYDIGHRAGEILLDRIAGGTPRPGSAVRIVLPTKLIIRASSQATSTARTHAKSRASQRVTQSASPAPGPEGG